MGEFRAFLMPFSFLRRWSYDELIPALLYFDQVTFLTEDLDDPDRLVDPRLLAGMDGEEFVNGLTVEQHRYFWPMRNLMIEKVIAISSMDLGSIYSPTQYREELETLSKLDGTRDLADTYVNSAARYYDFVEGRPTSGMDKVAKAIEVRCWIEEGLRFPRPGWQHVALHPDGYQALVAGLGLFHSMAQSSSKWYASKSPKQQSLDESYLAMRVVGNLLRKELSSFVLEDEGDAEALSEILEVRRKREVELREFREKMLLAADSLEWPTPGKFADAAQAYANELKPAFEQMNKALADPWRLPKLALRKGGSLLVIGIAAGIGYAAAGPVGLWIGPTAGLLTEAAKAVTGQLGKDAASKIEGSAEPVDHSMVYLFHARKALQQ